MGNAMKGPFDSCALTDACRQPLEDLNGQCEEKRLYLEKSDQRQVNGLRSAQAEVNFEAELLQTTPRGVPSSYVSHGAMPRRGRSAQQEAELVAKLHQLTIELFRLHDLNNDGLLQEAELVKLNEKIAMLHYGKDTDRSAIRSKYKDLFREKLDPEGRPVAFQHFEVYMQEVLRNLDPDVAGQELILEQFIEEARSGVQAFKCPSFHSVTDNQVQLAKHMLGPGI